MTFSKILFQVERYNQQAMETCQQCRALSD